LRIIAILGIIFVAALILSCAEEVTPPPSVSHDPSWINKADTAFFHGTKVFVIGQQTCKSCHGEDFSGGRSGVACADCHEYYPHPPEWTTPQDENSHGVYSKSIQWQIENCQSCHGEDYRGGKSRASCYDCHTQTGGPEACNVCHGTGADPVEVKSTWAPPQDLDDNIATTNIGVGAHQAHMTDTTYTTAYEQDCSLCHRQIEGFDDPRHRDGIDILFGDPATNGGEVTPEWDSASETCSDVYCHGNMPLGLNPDMIWNQVGAGQDSCGTCHGLPPAPPHAQIPNCNLCHSSVVDDEYNIINKELHINGETNYN